MFITVPVTSHWNEDEVSDLEELLQIGRNGTSSLLNESKESAVIIIDPQNMDKSCELSHSSFFKTHLF